MKKLMLVCGPAGIGKSTFCEAYRKEHPQEDVHVVAADEIRKAMYGGYDRFPPDHNMVFDLDRAFPNQHFVVLRPRGRLLRGL